MTASPTCSPTVPYHCNKAEKTTCVTPQTSTPRLSMVSQIPAKSVMISVPVTLLKNTPSLSMASQTPAKSVMNGVVLGALLGLSVVLLALVTIGWVCTCVAMKKKEAKKSQTHTRYKHVDNI